jgi:glycosyltransferase involved in cell wall biosynthesis
MVVSEAMSQGLPVITTDWAGVAQFIRPGENGLIVPVRDSEALGNALIWCAEHRTELRDMGMRARETAAQWQWADYRHAVAKAVIATLQAKARANIPAGAVA